MDNVESTTHASNDRSYSQEQMVRWERSTKSILVFI